LPGDFPGICPSDPLGATRIELNRKKASRRAKTEVTPVLVTERFPKNANGLMCCASQRDRPISESISKLTKLGLPGTMQNDWNNASIQIQGTYLDNQLRRTNRNLLLLAFGLILAIAGYGIAQYRYFYNFYDGPLETNLSVLERISHPEELSRYFVSIKGSEVFDSGLQDIETVTRSGIVESKTVKAEYVILDIDKHLLIVKRKPEDTSTMYQGALVALPTDIHARIVTPLLKDYPNADGMFLPLMLDATGFRSDGYVALLIATPLLLFAIWSIYRVVQRQNDVAKHPIIKAISRYGSPDIARQLDIELGPDAVRLRKVTITPSWIVLPTAFGLSICHIPDIIWAYKKVTKHSVNFIPTGKSYAVMVWDRYGISLELSASLKKADAILQTLVGSVPWAVFGYTDELKQAMNDWPAAVAFVDTQRAGIKV
jgi:hypothetical protein